MPDGDKNVQIYRPNIGETSDLYTSHPSQTLSTSEGTPREDHNDTTSATWTHWKALGVTALS